MVTMLSKKMKTGNKGLEELASRAEIQLDSSTQKALKGLAYIRIMKEKIREQNGFRQFTITSPGPDVNPKKPWKFQVKNPEDGLKAECFHCGKTFTKREECSKCKVYSCNECGKCGCQLGPEAKRVLYAVLRTNFGVVGEPELDYWKEVTA